MAVQDARISTCLPSHPKTKKLAKRVGFSGCWHLVCLFLWAAANRSDGSLAGMTTEDIEIAVDWGGDGGTFVLALKEVGFLDGSEGAYEIHDWAEHNPWAADAGMRSSKARWNAIKRHYGEAEADRRAPEYAAIRLADNGGSNAAGIASSTAINATSNAASNAPSPSPSPYPYPSQKSIGANAPESGFENLSNEVGDEPAQVIKLPAAFGVRELIAEGVNPQHAKDWLKVRKDKRAPLTPTAWADVKAEAEKARVTPAQAVEIAAKSSWQGFKADWVMSGSMKQGTAAKVSKASQLGGGRKRLGS